MYFDVHSHAQGFSDVHTIRNIYYGEFGADSIPETPCSVGLHPWYLAAESIETALAWVERNAGQSQVQAIGECGLDKLRASLPLNTQSEIFKRQIAVSEAHQKPLIIHCVRAHQEVLNMHRMLQPRMPWILHGFNKSHRVAAPLLQSGFYLSFGAALEKEDAVAGQVLRNMYQGSYRDNILFETDATGKRIQEIYAWAARTLDVDIEVLQGQVAENFLRLFPYFGK